MRTLGMMCGVVLTLVHCTTFDGYSLAVPDGSADADATKDAGPLATDRAEVGTPLDAGAEADAGAPSCPGAAPSAYPDKPAKAAQPGACSAADKAALTKLVGGPINHADLATKLSASCHACAVSRESDESWSSIVLFPDDGTFFNAAHCMKLAGTDDLCATAAQRMDFCSYAACATCDTGAKSKCRNSSTLDICLATLNAANTVCSKQSWSDTCPGSNDLVAHALKGCL